VSIARRFVTDNRPLHKTVLNLTWPVIIANLSLPLAGAVDTAVVGHLPNPAYIGAVALGALVFSAIGWLFGFLRMGTTGLVAQSLGADDANEITASYLRALAIALVIGLSVVLLQKPLGTIVFWFFEASAQVERFGLDYFDIRVWGAPFAMLNLVNLGLLFGLQKMRTALVLQLVLNGMNIVLDLVFVMGFGWSVSGVAAATLISEAVTAIAGLWICLRLLGLNADRISRIHVFQKQKLIQFGQINFNIMVRTLSLEIVFVYFMWISAKQGEVVLAANAVLIHLLHFVAYGMDGFAHAAEALAGNAYGAKNRKRLHDVVFVTLGWSVVVGIAFCLVYLAGGNFIVGLLTGIPEVRSAASQYMIWLILMPLFSLWPFLFDGVYIGMTRTVEMRNCMLISTAAFFAVSYPLSILWDNHGLWVGILFFMAVRGLTMGLWYRRIEARVGLAS